MKAVVLCGGLGTRLGKLTQDTPKPLMLVAGRPFLAHVLDKLCVPEVDGFILATGFKAEQVERSIGTYWLGRNVLYSVEPEARGTGGALRLAMETFAQETVLVANGDTLFDCDLSAWMAGFDTSSWATRMALREVDDCGRYGRVQMGRGQGVIAFGEKGHAGPGLINAGLYLQRWAPLAGFGTKPFSLESDYLALLRPQWPIQGVTCNGYFIDIGIPEDLARAQRDLGVSGAAEGGLPNVRLA
jgi:D-glycero-alpha-D-manno-heptose 1-phosphate guanylyltransferase